MSEAIGAALFYWSTGVVVSATASYICHKIPNFDDIRDDYLSELDASLFVGKNLSTLWIASFYTDKFLHGYAMYAGIYAGARWLAWMRKG